MGIASHSEQGYPVNNKIYRCRPYDPMNFLNFGHSLISFLATLKGLALDRIACQSSPKLQPTQNQHVNMFHLYDQVPTLSQDKNISIGRFLKHPRPVSQPHSQWKLLGWAFDFTRWAFFLSI